MPSSKFGPLPTQTQWESELRSCYKSVSKGFEASNGHLFVRESIAIRNLRINAVICGFEKTNELFKLKLEGWVEDESYDGFQPDFEHNEDSDYESDGPTDGWRYRTNAEKLTLRTNFLQYNIRFWLGIFKYHPLFYHHRCFDWAKHNNPKMISMCPMSHSNTNWRYRNSLGFIDSTLSTKGDACSINEFKPVVCHKKKLRNA